VRIVVDALSLGTGGGRVYATNILRNMANANPQVSFVVYGPSIRASDFRNMPHNVIFREISTQPLAVILNPLWRNLVLPAAARSVGASTVLFLGVGSALPTNTLGIPGVFVAQNMLALHPDSFHWYRTNRQQLLRLLYLRLMTLYSCRTAAHIIAVSNTTRQAILKTCRVAAEKVTTVLHGVDHERFRPVSKQEVVSVCRSLGFSPGYLLSISSIFRYKNYINLIRAYHLLRQEHLISEPLVIVGEVKETDYYKRMLREIERLGLGSNVLILRGIEQSQLPALYCGASVYVFPSICEVFGLTLVEAMACGVPVVTSNLSAMPEICGDAALYFDPFDPEDIAAKLAVVLRDKALAHQLAQQGRARARSFSWERTARETFRVLACLASDAAALKLAEE